LFPIFATGIFLTPLATSTWVSTTPAELVAKFAPSVINTGGKVAAGVVDTGGKFATVVHLYL
jgi:hypothetical protein